MGNSIPKSIPKSLDPSLVNHEVVPPVDTDTVSPEDTDTDTYTDIGYPEDTDTVSPEDTETVPVSPVSQVDTDTVPDTTPVYPVDTDTLSVSEPTKRLLTAGALSTSDSSSLTQEEYERMIEIWVTNHSDSESRLDLWFHLFDFNKGHDLLVTNVFTLERQPLHTDHRMKGMARRRVTDVKWLNLVNDFACPWGPCDYGIIGNTMDYAGPSVLFRDPSFKTQIQKELDTQLNPVACVNNKVLYNVDTSVGMMALLGTLMPTLKEYSNASKIQLLAMFLFGVIHDDPWKTTSDVIFQAQTEMETRESIRTRVEALLPTTIKDEVETVRLVMMASVGHEHDDEEGHWILIVFDFDVSGKKPLGHATNAFYLPEWNFDCSSLVRTIATTCNFELIGEPTLVQAGTSRSLTDLQSKGVKLLCGCTALRHLIMCSVVTTGELLDQTIHAQFKKLDEHVCDLTFSIFSDMWAALYAKKQELDQETLAKWTKQDQQPGTGFTMYFLLLCSPVKDPGVDVSNCVDPPFVELGVYFPANQHKPPRIVRHRSLSYINKIWTSKPHRPEACTLSTEFLTMDILSALHRRVMGIESKLM